MPHDHYNTYEQDKTHNKNMITLDKFVKNIHYYFLALLSITLLSVIIFISSRYNKDYRGNFAKTVQFEIDELEHEVIDEIKYLEKEAEEEFEFFSFNSFEDEIVQEVEVIKEKSEEAEKAVAEFLDLETKKCGINLKHCHPVDPNKLNLHVIAHTHTDPGWLKTVDQYYIDQVQWIISTVITELADDPDRRFIFVETSFFQRWWRRQTDRKKNQVRNLVNNGQLTFTEGFWTQPDEAITHYSDVILNAEVGSRFLESEFGICFKSKSIWQIDPFGHSIGLMDIFSRMEYSSFFFGRLDANDKKTRRDFNNMEFFWRRGKRQMFTSVLPNLYVHPPSFCWTEGCNTARVSNTFIQDDPEIDNENIDVKMRAFAKYLEDWRKPGYRTNNFMVMMGGDFHFTNANQNFQNIERLMKYFNKQQSQYVNMFYSTPECYAAAVKNVAKNATWQFHVETKDFFPYSDSYTEAYKDRCHWTGYYSSRPILKTETRNKSAIAMACSQLELTGKTKLKSCDKLRKAVSLLQHHDAITGTEMPNVINDYLSRLDKAVNYFFNSINPAKWGNSMLSNILWPQPNGIKMSKITLYNTLSWPTVENINGHPVPVPALGYLEITEPVSGPQTEPIRHPDDQFEANFDRSRKEREAVNAHKPVPSHNHHDHPYAKLNNEFYEITMHATENNTVRMEVTDKSKTVNNHFDLEILWQAYKASDGSHGDRVNSGAYVFKPAENKAPRRLGFIKGLKMKDNGGGVQVDMMIDWLEYSIQLDVSKIFPSIIIEYKLGPIPLSDPAAKHESVKSASKTATPFEWGKEVIFKLAVNKIDTVNIETQRFFTDTNSYGFIERDRSKFVHADPIASRYFPIASQCYSEFESQRLENSNSTVRTNILATLNRAAGTASLRYDLMEIMLHRRTLFNDNMGLQGAMDDTSITEGKIYLNFNVQNYEDFKVIEKKVNYPLFKVYEYESVEYAMREPEGRDNENDLLSYVCESNDSGDSEQPEQSDKKNKIAIKVKNCSFLIQNFPTNIYILSINRDDFNKNILLLRLENFSSKKAYQLEKLSSYLHFSKSVVKIEEVNLAGVSKDKVKFYESDKGFVIGPKDILSLRVYF